LASWPALTGEGGGALGSASSLSVTVFLSAAARVTLALDFKKPEALASIT
jgi:hypothetical protein